MSRRVATLGSWRTNLVRVLPPLPHYHRRSNVETAFAMIKAKFGSAVASRLPTAQANEFLARCVAHNLCCVVKAIFTAGLAPTFWPNAPAALPSPVEPS